MARRFLIIGILCFCLVALTIAAILPDQVQPGMSSQSHAALLNSGTGALAFDLIETPTPEPTPTFALPPEYLANGQMTVGITIGAAVLILIVVGGTISFLPRKEQ